MALTVKTPGVYIEEVPKFPPSIAQVETAIPAFIGYTAKADEYGPGDLKNKAVKISSLLDYETYFGGAPSLAVSQVTVDALNNFKSAIISQALFMYDSLRMFFKNGGGDCYIVSVGSYTDPKSKNDFLDDGKGLKVIEKVDEPTLLIFPDNSLLTNGNDYYEVYQEALLQCENLKDRFVVMDVKNNDYKGDAFRSSIGINNLKYGAVYTPWLEVIMPRQIKYSDFMNTAASPNRFQREGVNITLSQIYTGGEAAITDQIAKVVSAIADNGKVATSITAIRGASATVAERYTVLENALSATPDPTNLQNVMDFLFDVAREIDKLTGATADAVSSNLKPGFETTITSLGNAYSKVISYEVEADAELSGAYTVQHSISSPTHANWGTIFSAPPASLNVMTGADDAAMIRSIIPLLRTEFNFINSYLSSAIVKTAALTEQEADKGLAIVLPAYKAILDGIQNTKTILPPSGSVTGIYAFVDRTRGVWKAPANVSISGIIGPAFTFNAGQLDALNIDVTAGKSINAIRAFTGKGTLVYGARTLAGNDNEWRYVSVRRLFNMIEESVKKATEQFVFEPNDANTWTKVKAMISNYLTVLWRQGALAGAKPEHAFYVACGLGATMTAVDILEGKLIVEIGLAAVRPAEFIILRFSHKMQES
ncbi:phage tail sheath C-terminal domain-containing protein [Lacibacter sp. H375]|uniref:phage tail sheath C-terminal domain-containing protein n=1 Tax=Lacibacter sp. H375 TaxID=3133424 RepID=UPI0030BFC272